VNTAKPVHHVQYAQEVRCGPPPSIGCVVVYGMIMGWRAASDAAARTSCSGCWLGRTGSVEVVDLSGLIDVRAGVRSGKPCFVVTRIAVYDVPEYLAGGMSPDQVVGDFPELTHDHVRAALEFAALRERRLATPA
jgi:uncharacterized protein (DUF433 family)